MTPHELALLYLEQLRAYDDDVPAPREEPNALFLWEEWICDEPERAWPVFEEILARVSDDDTLEQVWYRLRLLVHRHDTFRERAAELLDRYRRLAVIAGPDALAPERFTERPLDTEALIAAYRASHRSRDAVDELEALMHANPRRALGLAIEIVHRGVARGWDIFDLMSPLQDVIVHGGEPIVARVEEAAKESVPIRRVLWRLKRHLRHREMDGELRERALRAAGATTEYTELDVPPPPPQPQLDADERIIEGWFTHEENFWGFSALHDLCTENPRLAWSVTQELIARAEDEEEIGVTAAGPLEDLIRTQPDVIWEELTAKAFSDERFRSALEGVWVFEKDGEVYQRFRELMESLGQTPN